MKPVENEIKKNGKAESWKHVPPIGILHHAAPLELCRIWKGTFSERFWFFFFPAGHFFFCGNVWRFFSEILGKWSKFLWWKRGYCCVLSDFLILYTTAATSSLSVYSHHLQRASFCRFHPAASLFISATLTLTSPVCFFIASLLCAAPSSPVVIGLSCSPIALCSALLNTFTSLLTRVYFCFFPIFVFKVVIALFHNLVLPPPQIWLNLNQPGGADKEVSIWVILCSICLCHWVCLYFGCLLVTQKNRPRFYCTSLLKTSPNLCSASSDARQEAAEEAR